jgi:hypothetical protein
LNFPNKKIFRLIKQKRRKYGYGPWETEIYGNGEIFRKKYFYPSFLPMYVGCDHGVNWGSKLRPNEIKNNFDYFFTYNKQKLKKINNKKIFKAINIEHPWIFYKKFLYDKKKLSNIKKKGTIVFFPHNIKSGSVNFNVNQYLKKLKNLSDKFKPITICLYHFDINQSFINKLRNKKFRVVSAGHPLNKNFVDNFYEIISHFEYGTSPLINSIGSNTYFCVNAGLKYFFYGGVAKKKLNNFRNKKKFLLNLNFYSYKSEQKIFYEIKKLFSFKNVDNSKLFFKKKQIVNKILSVDCNENRLKISFLLYYSFVKNINLYIKTHINYIIKKFFKNF